MTEGVAVAPVSPHLPEVPTTTGRVWPPPPVQGGRTVGPGGRDGRGGALAGAGEVQGLEETSRRPVPRPRPQSVCPFNVNRLLPPFNSYEGQRWSQGGNGHVCLIGTPTAGEGNHELFSGPYM